MAINIINCFNKKGLTHANYPTSKPLGDIFISPCLTHSRADEQGFDSPMHLDE